MLLEHLFGLRDGHPFGVHADGGQQPYVAQQRVGELTDMLRRVTLSQALLVHHLLAVVSPAFGKGITHPQCLELVGIGVRVQEL